MRKPLPTPMPQFSRYCDVVPIQKTLFARKPQVCPWIRRPPAFPRMRTLLLPDGVAAVRECEEKGLGGRYSRSYDIHSLDAFRDDKCGSVLNGFIRACFSSPNHPAQTSFFQTHISTPTGNKHTVNTWTGLLHVSRSETTVWTTPGAHRPWCPPMLGPPRCSFAERGLRHTEPLCDRRR